MSDTVYLIHFDAPFRHAQHYIGYTKLSVKERMERHRSGHGAQLLKQVQNAGIGWRVVRTWSVPTGEGRKLEIKLKRRGGGRRVCPICKKGTGE